MVELLSHTPSPLMIITQACKQCTNWDSKITVPDANLVRKVIASGHTSVLEHASFTFRVVCSRTCTHQLVRHRLASYSQVSQRYCPVNPDSAIIPQSIVNLPEMNELYKSLTGAMYALYKDLIEKGVPKEDARFILPEGTATAIIVTMNCRELFHFFEERLCYRAQWEIRDIASGMLELCKKVEPLLFENVGPKCLRLKKCFEARPCNKHPFLTK